MLPRALRAAAPLLAGHGVVLVSGFLLQVALVAWVFRPEEMATVGLLSQALQWVAVVALAGLPAGLLRHVPARPGEEADLLTTARAFVFLTTVATALTATFLPGPVRSLIGDADAARLFGVYAWRAPPLAHLVLIAAWLHAQGRLRPKAVIESAERVLVLVLALAFAAADGLGGFVVGSIAATILAYLVAYRWLPRGGRVRLRLLGPLLRVGAPQLAIGLLETARPLVVLGLATRTVGDRDTGLLATAMGFSLPLIALPELAAQALFPGMHGPAGEGRHVRSEATRVVREVLLTGAVLLTVYGVAAAWLLPLAGRGGYAGAVLPLIALLPGVLAHGLSSHAGYVLLIRDRLPATACASAVSVAVAGLLAWQLFPAMGAVGGAIALSAAALVRTAIILVAARRA